MGGRGRGEKGRPRPVRKREAPAETPPGAVLYQPFGAARTVTGSRHLFRRGRRTLLLDCGLFQGHRQESNERNRHLPLHEGLECVVLSHAHIDHSGALPMLVRDGFRGPIHATKATRDLCRAMLADAALLAENDARHLNRRRGKGEPPVEPLYTREDADRALEQFRTHAYDEPFPATLGARVTFRDAGHILGSAGVLLEFEGAPTVYFTGDLGRKTYPILRDPEPLPECDVVLSESTYGTRDHEPLGDAERTLEEAVARACRQRGKLYVPAFSVGRTQNLVYAMARLWERKAVPRIPIYVDSPLALEATRAFVDNPDVFDSEVRAFIGEGGDPFYPHGVRYLATREQSMELNDRPGPFMVIAGSGMCEGGRIVHHLANGIGDPRNTVLFVGYAAPYTLARRILDGQKEVRILGHAHTVRAQVERIAAYSAHADRTDLLHFLAPARTFGAAIYLVHGDEDASLAFAEALRAEGHEEVVVPETYATYVLRRRG